jgi:hypothetical protein
MYELYKSAVSADKKEAKLKAKIESMESKLDMANQSLATLIDHIGKHANYVSGLKVERESKLEELIRKREHSRLKIFE